MNDLNVFLNNLFKNIRIPTSLMFSDSDFHFNFITCYYLLLFSLLLEVWCGLCGAYVLY